MINELELFPLRVAVGKRFCNRTEEKAFLKDCIYQKRPTVIISPRRYGKTSLACKVVEELAYPFCSIDFLTAYDDNSICLNIIKGVSELISQIMPINMKTLKLIEKCFHGVKAIMRYKFIELEFTSAIDKSDPVRQVLEILKGLENIAAFLDKTVVVFIDEFQMILETPRGDAIQGAIRHIAQTAKKTAFLFSGSSRHMLSKAFDDPNYPLYMMCEKLNLERIHSAEYIPYIQDAANIKWKKALPMIVIQRIFDLTENHPFYINFLCSNVWKYTEHPLDEHKIDEAWHECYLREQRRLIVELDRLTTNQKILLKAIAHSSNLTEPTSSIFLSPLGISSGSAVPALKVLTNKDMIFIDKNGITRILDPLLKYMLLISI